MPYRGEGHVRFNSGTIKRGNISGPVQLLSTTNMLAYNAPDINGRNTSSASSVDSKEDSDTGISPQSYSSSTTHITAPDFSPHESSPVDSNAQYFPKQPETIISHPRSSTTSSSSTDAPMVPRRAPTHTKRYQELARKRSQRMEAPPVEPPRSTPVVATQDVFKPEAHPFGKELEQVNQVAEGFRSPHVMDEEEQILHRKGLKKFTVDDYLAEIEELYGSIFDDKLGPIAAGAWL